MDNEQRIEVDLHEYTGLLQIARMFYGVMYQLGGRYEVTMDNLERGLDGEVSIQGLPNRKSAVITLENTSEPIPQAEIHEFTSAKVAAAAAKILKDKKASKVVKSVAASALTQKKKKPT